MYDRVAFKMPTNVPQPVVRDKGLQPYVACWQEMQRFNAQRTQKQADEIWLLEHPPVFTQGQCGKAEHVLNPGSIPLVQTDRGGQVTYHGPGQLVCYVLIDMKRLCITIRALVTALERAVVSLLAHDQIAATVDEKARGVYVNQAKICSIGLRVKKYCSYHGLALNVHGVDLTAFQRIAPCGYKDLAVTQLSDCGGSSNLSMVKQLLTHYLKEQLYARIRVV